MDATLRDRADARLEEALARAGLQDPRGFYREWLRALRDRDGEAFDEARRHYEETLLPRVAQEGTDPIEEWLEYGRRLAEMSGPGDLVEIDEDGRSRVAATPATRDRLILYLPASPREPARILNLPVRLSAAQRANVALLIEGRLAPPIEE